MNDSEFEAALTRLYEQAPPAADEDEFVTTLAKRRAAQRFHRLVLLGFLGAVGCFLTARWLVRWDVLFLADVAHVPLQIVEAASRSWLSLILVFVLFGQAAQRMQDRI